MKLSAVLVAGLVLAGTAQAATYGGTYTSGFALGGAIPDADYTGWYDTRTLSGITDLTITDVNVSLILSGGHNGDLYAYLSNDSGLAILLNRVGTGLGGEPQYSFGYTTAGMNVTLDDQSLNGNIHNQAGDPLSGTFVSDGTLGNNLSVFNNLNPNGNWTLFIADLSGPDASTSLITSWTLNITAVPEPITWALLLFGGVLGTVKLGRFLGRRQAA